MPDDSLDPTPLKTQIDLPGLHHSEEFKQIYAALIAAQKEFTPVPKNKVATVRSQRTGATYTYKYADLADILSMALPVLTKHELGVMQPNVLIHGQLRVVTRLIHSSGQWLEGDGLALLEAQSRQDFGGESSYNRRYDICSMLGIVADEDVDAQLGTVGTTPAEADKQPRVRQPEAKREIKPEARVAAQKPATPAEQLLIERDSLIDQLKAAEPNGKKLGQRAKAMFPQHQNTNTLTVADLRALLETILKEKAEQEKQAVSDSMPPDIPPDVAAMFDDGRLTTGRRLKGPTIGKGRAQKLHKLIGMYKIHTEEELHEDYLKPIGLDMDHLSDLPEDLYDSLCDWAEGKLVEGTLGEE